jgi:hypothetical protein
MLDGVPNAMPEARATLPSTRHGRDKPPRMADSLGFRRQVKLLQLHLFSTRPRRFIDAAASLSLLALLPVQWRQERVRAAPRGPHAPARSHAVASTGRKGHGRLGGSIDDGRHHALAMVVV